MKSGIVHVSATILALVFLSGHALPAQELYTETGGPNPPFSSFDMVRGDICTDQFFDGSTIDVQNDLVEQGPYAGNPIDPRIKIHVLCNSVVQREDFPLYKRWYQEDGNTQVFRLFEGEENRHNERLGAARIEAHGAVRYQRGDGWQTWMGRYTIIKPHPCIIFQAKNNDYSWAVSLNLTEEGDVILNHRRHQDDRYLARNMAGKSFDIMVKDDGYDYKVWYNGDLAGEGYYSRPSGYTTFRWGMYNESKNGRYIQHDAMLFVTGATVLPAPDPAEVNGSGRNGDGELRFEAGSTVHTFGGPVSTVRILSPRGLLMNELRPVSNTILYNGMDRYGRVLPPGIYIVSAGTMSIKLSYP